MTDTAAPHADSAPASTGTPAPHAQADTEPKPATGRARRGKKRNTEPPAIRSDGRARLAAPGQVRFDVAQFLVAFCILGVYIASMWLMFQHRADQQWDRMVYLFTGFEAIVFVAAGAIFGTRIQRASVETAHEQSRQANEQSRQAHEQSRQAHEELQTERERADQLEEATAAFFKTLAVYASQRPQNADNGQPRSTTSPENIAVRDRRSTAAPPADNSDLSFIIKLAEELLRPGRG